MTRSYKFDNGKGQVDVISEGEILLLRTNHIDWGYKLEEIKGVQYPYGPDKRLFVQREADRWMADGWRPIHVD